MTGTGENERSEQELVLRARNGEIRAFEELLSRHESRVIRVLTLMGVRLQDREDVAQEVFIRIFRHLNGFKRGRPFRSWVYRIAVNAAHDYRSRSAKAAVEDSLDESPGPAETGDQDARIDLRRELLGAMTLLTDRERAVFILRELEGLESREIASTLGITSITVRRHLGRARTRLQQALTGRVER